MSSQRKSARLHQNQQASSAASAAAPPASSSTPPTASSSTRRPRVSRPDANSLMPYMIPSHGSDNDLLSGNYSEFTGEIVSNMVKNAQMAAMRRQTGKRKPKRRRGANSSEGEEEKKEEESEAVAAAGRTPKRQPMSERYDTSMFKPDNSFLYKVCLPAMSLDEALEQEQKETVRQSSSSSSSSSSSLAAESSFLSSSSSGTSSSSSSSSLATFISHPNVAAVRTRLLNLYPSVASLAEATGLHPAPADWPLAAAYVVSPMIEIPFFLSPPTNGVNSTQTYEKQLKEAKQRVKQS